MSRSEQKIVQYLNEAHASELALVRVLQSQIAMTPRGTLPQRAGDAPGRDARPRRARADAAGRARRRRQPAAVPRRRRRDRRRRRRSRWPRRRSISLRGSGGEEKVLKNAKDACATEALEIATYTAIERLARSVGDEQTAKLAASIRADEEKMLERIMREIPKLTEAVVGADVEDDPSYDVTKTGAADAARATGKAAAKTARKTGAKAKRSTRQARKVPGVAQAEGQVKGAVASQSDLAIAGYDKLTAEEIVAQALRALADRPRQGRLLRAQAREPHHGPRPRQHAARRRAVAGLRRAHRRRGPDRARRGRRRPRQGRARLRARPQGPRRRAQGHRAPHRHAARQRASPADVPARANGADAGTDAHQALQAAADAGDGSRGVHALGAAPRRRLRRSRRLAPNGRGPG